MIASAVGGIPLQVLHERTGILVRSVEGCAGQIVRLLRDPALRRRLGAAGREHIRDNFLHPREARDYLTLFLALQVRSSSSRTPISFPTACGCRSGRSSARSS